MDKCSLFFTGDLIETIVDVLGFADDFGAFDRSKIEENFLNDCLRWHGNWRTCDDGRGSIEALSIVRTGVRIFEFKRALDMSFRFGLGVKFVERHLAYDGDFVVSSKAYESLERIQVTGR